MVTVLCLGLTLGSGVGDALGIGEVSRSGNGVGLRPLFYFPDVPSSLLRTESILRSWLLRLELWCLVRIALSLALLAGGGISRQTEVVVYYAAGMCAGVGAGVLAAGAGIGVGVLLALLALVDLCELLGILRRAHLLHVDLLGGGYALALCGNLLLYNGLLLDACWLLAHVDQLTVI